VRLMRNKDIKRFVILYTLFVLAASVGAAFISRVAAVLLLGFGAISLIAFVLYTNKRHRDISRLSRQVDSILHGEYNINLTPDEEGELAVLSSELSKMTLRLREQAEQLSKDKEYLRDSLADISHQLRTPLTSVRMIVPRLEQDDLSPEQRLADTRKADNLLERTQWLIATLLQIARLESGTVSFAEDTISIAEVIRQATAPLELLMDIRNVNLSLDIPDSASYVGDRQWSVEAFGNIIKNCIEHCSGGTIEIKAEENPVYSQIIISDNGEGFAEEDLPHLFDRFYRGNNAVSGSAGIGLNLARMIIAQQNGTIKAENRTGGGAQFTIKFYKGAI